MVYGPRADMKTPLCAKTLSRQNPRPRYAHLYRFFHDYFITHIPSSSLHPDSRASSGPGHQLPRSASKPHDSKSGPSPAPIPGAHRDTTVVRIPIRSAKHHFGASVSRGTRPYNEDAFQAGVVSVPAFAKRGPQSVSRAPVGSVLEKYREKQRQDREAKAQDDKTTPDADANNGRDMAGNDSVTGDPQVFYFGVFDGHGGAQCSGYLSRKLHEAIEETAKLYELQSTLRSADHESLGNPSSASSGVYSEQASSRMPTNHAIPLLQSYKANVGGYFRRFSPPLLTGTPSKSSSTSTTSSPTPSEPPTPTISTILTHAFLSTDLDFVLEQHRLAASLRSSNDGDLPINALDSHYQYSSTFNNPPSITPRNSQPFKGGSTASVALISTPTPSPFWHPSTTATIAVAHVGDTRILLSRVSDGAALPLTSLHHASAPGEAARLRRWAPSSFDSFGEERILGSLANTRSFGDVSSKPLGVSAEPEITILGLGAAEYAFMVLVSDGVTAALSDQEIVDVVKECKNPDEACREVTNYAVEVTGAGDEGADNCTCLVVRMGGWERRSEGGGGGLGTREERNWRKREAGEGGRRRT